MDPRAHNLVPIQSPASTFHLALLPMTFTVAHSEPHSVPPRHRSELRKALLQVVICLALGLPPLPQKLALMDPKPFKPLHCHYAKVLGSSKKSTRATCVLLLWKLKKSGAPNMDPKYYGPYNRDSPNGAPKMFGNLLCHKLKTAWRASSCACWTIWSRGSFGSGLPSPKAPNSPKPRIVWSLGQKTMQYES